MLDKYTHIIFDFDETLATLKVNWAMWHPGVSGIIKRYDPTADLPKMLNHPLLNSCIKKYGEPLRTEIWDFTTDYELSNYQGMVKNEVALSLLNSIGAGQYAYILTTNSKAVIMPALAELGIKDQFSKIITRDEVLLIKPDPHPFELIYDGVSDKSTYVMVGDSSSDEGFASSVGIDFINVKNI